MKPKIIAFYLPQYHPTPHNDEWWGKGFTEWTNVAKAKPLYRGHYQPHIPADLGFYDLRLPQVRQQQAELAKEAGIEGFCYYHYWFGNGELELEKPLESVIASGEPDFPLCLCWANESWYAKMWNNEGNVIGKKCLAEQKYLGTADNTKHFNYLLNTFKDKRYIKIDGKLLFVIYKPLEFYDIKGFMNDWNRLAKDNGLPEFYFVGYTTNIEKELKDILSSGFNSVISCNITKPLAESCRNPLKRVMDKIINKLFQKPRIIDYSKNIRLLSSEYDKEENVIPCLIPNWDHTPRSGYGGYLYENATPEAFEKHVEMVLNSVKDKSPGNQIVFLKSWNEWGEGNYMEPDLKYDKGFINALSKSLMKISIMK